LRWQSSFGTPGGGSSAATLFRRPIASASSRRDPTATIVEFKLDVPGNYILMDHALSRAERGLVGILQVEGDVNPEIFEGKVEPGSGH
jgi:hypothetical protein